MTLLKTACTGFAAFLCMAASAPADSGFRAVAKDRPTLLAQAELETPKASAQMIESCLENPNRTCALASALLVTAEEELPIARVDTLIALGKSFARIGDQDRAAQTLDLALEAARDIGISIGTEQKLALIVGPLTEIGRSEEAIAIASDLNDRFLKADAFGEIALAEARRGNIAAALDHLDRITEPLLALRSTVSMIEWLANEDQNDADLPVSALMDRLDNLDHDLLKALGETRLARIEAERGQPETARDLIAKASEALGALSLNHERARLYAGLALASQALGDQASYEDYADRAANLAAGVRSDYDRPIAIADAVHALTLGGHIDRAAKLAQSVTGLREQSALIRRLAALPGSRPIVQALSDHLLALLTEEDSRFERDRARVAMAEALGDVAAIEQATRIIAAIESDDAQGQALAVLARSL
ncbi:hypothetical protein AQ1_01981 [alpha proteobacterium Q-1]|nr:hypothetical protein AQ1_01981 [alpha proteobacterium Q-1]